MPHVVNVRCPECGRTWTGEFADGAIQEAMCVDCMNEGKGKRSDSPDIHLNPKAPR